MAGSHDFECWNSLGPERYLTVDGHDQNVRSHHLLVLQFQIGALVC